MTNLRQRFKAYMKHEHSWVEDKWGKRCSDCGTVRTHRSKKIDIYLLRVVQWAIWIVGLFFALLALAINLIDPINEMDMKRMQVAGGSAYWILMCLFIAVISVLLSHIARHWGVGTEDA